MMDKALQFQPKVYVGIGSNLGDREQYLLQAVMRLEQHPAISAVRRSAIYETAPVDYLQQGPFLNMVVELLTVLSPRVLLDLLQQIEGELGRTRDIRYGPRTVDLDILLYGDQYIEHPDLTIPHPRMLERLFVLIPLADLYEGNTLPGMPIHESISERINNLKGKDGVVPWKPKS